MIDASSALQIAVRTALIADPVLANLVSAANVIDHTGPAAIFPSVLIGEGQTIEDDQVQTLRRTMLRVFLDLHVWDASADLGSVKAIAGAIRNALRDLAPAAIEDHQLIDLAFPNTRFLRDKESDTPLAHGVVQIKALLQEVLQ